MIWSGWGRVEEDGGNGGMWDRDWGGRGRDSGIGRGSVGKQRKAERRGGIGYKNSGLRREGLLRR